MKEWKREREKERKSERDSDGKRERKKNKNPVESLEAAFDVVPSKLGNVVPEKTDLVLEL